MVTIRDAEQAERWRGEAERWRGEAERLADENGRLRVHGTELKGQVEALAEKVATLSRLLFGDSSEKQKKKRGRASEDDEHDDVDGGGGDACGEGGGRRRGQRPGSRGHGRRDYSHLETEEEVHDVDEGQRRCTRCGTAYADFGEETSEQIDWRVKVVRIVHRRRSYRAACGCAERGVVTAPVPAKPIAKGRFTSQFLARLLVDKYVSGRPLSRIAASLSHEGFEVAPGTLVGALKTCSGLLAPLDAQIRDRNAAAGHLHVDETSWKVFETVAGKANQRWWLWVFVAADTTLFTIEPSRSTRVLADHLDIDLVAGELTAGRRLLVSSDFFTVYQALDRVQGVDALWCWAHIRRYFIRAGDAHPQALARWRDAWLGRIARLYAAHETLADTQPGSPAHLQAEADFAACLEAMDVARQVEIDDATLHPAALKVLATLDHEWDGLVRHREFPQLPLDNNTAERGLRSPVVGRKNYYGSGAVWAATLAGRIWSITATIARAGGNPLEHLIGYLDACATAGGRPPDDDVLAGFLPWRATVEQQARWQTHRGGPSP